MVFEGLTLLLSIFKTVHVGEPVTAGFGGESRHLRSCRNFDHLTVNSCSTRSSSTTLCCVVRRTEGVAAMFGPKPNPAASQMRQVRGDMVRTIPRPLHLLIDMVISDTQHFSVRKSD